MQDNTSFDNNKDGDVEVVEVIATSHLKESTNTPAKKKSTLISRIEAGLHVAKGQFFSTYAKRNPLANALLSLYALATLFLTTFLLYASVLFIFTDSEWLNLTLAIPGIVYTCFCYYFTYRFVIANRKDAVWPAILGGSCIWFIVLWFIALLYSPEEYEENIDRSVMNAIIEIIWPLVLYGILSTAVFGAIRVVMSLKKYGASAWSLLDVSRRKRPLYEKVLIWLFFTVWLLPVGYEFIEQYRLYHPKDTYPSHANARIGDYYYTDGTVTSNWLVDKTVAGVVFSLETSEADKAQGFVHGQIVAYSDLSDKKQSWDNGNHHDISEYPNYDWSNRLYALKDINGLGYMHCDGYSALPITLSCLHYLEGEPTQGISNWHVPTAGQWTKILENLGHVKVDRMLKFDADTASNNLDWIHLDPQRWYWTITEFDSDNAWSIRLKNGEFGSRSNKQNGAFVRPVASF